MTTSNISAGTGGAFLPLSADADAAEPIALVIDLPTQCFATTIKGLAGGGYVVAYQQMLNGGLQGIIHCQVYDDTGAKVGAESVAVGSSEFRFKFFDGIVALDDGGFLLTWDYDAYGTVHGAGERFAADGTAIELVPELHHRVVGTVGDNYVGVVDDFPSGSGGGLRLQLFAADFTPVGDGQSIDTSGIFADFAKLENGGFVVMFDQDYWSPDTRHVQRFDETGKEVGPAISVPFGNIAALNGGGYVITWVSHVDDIFNEDVFSQLYDDSGNKIGDAINVATGLSDVFVPQVVALQGGGFVVAWDDWSAIHAQRFDAAGTLVESQSFNSPDLNAYTLTALVNGGYTLDWWVNDVDTSKIYEVIISPPATQSADIYGNGNNNQMDGTTGVGLHMHGLGGDDTYIVDDAADQVIETVKNGDAGGIDTVRASVSFTLGAYVENLILTGSVHINATGNAMANIIHGNAGDNIISGGAGADSMSGGGGNDTFFVDTIGDVVVELKDGGTDKVNSKVSFALGHAYVEILNLVGTADIDGTGNAIANAILGNNGANRLDGGGGDDTLNGRGGRDSLIGGSGNDQLNGGTGGDTMAGGAGNDTYAVDEGGDLVTETGGQGTDVVLSSISYTLTRNVENLTLTGTANIDAIGNSGDNLLTGNSGNNLLNGKTGMDVMAGGLGDDTYAIDNAGDRVHEAAGEGTDMVKAGVSYNATGQSIEIIVLTGSATIDATGQGLDNQITGNSANNKLAGGAGNDTLNGGSGADILVGGNGADVFLFRSGSGQDVVSDFHVTQDDLIDVHAYTNGVVHGGGVVISQSGNNAIIDLGSGNAITVFNVVATSSGFLDHIVW